MFTSLDGVDLAGRRVFVRLFLGTADAAGRLEDPSILAGALPTLRELRELGSRVVVGAGVAPAGAGAPAPSLETAGMTLSELLGCDVVLPDDCIGDAAKKVVSDLRPGQVCLLENLARHDEEEAADEVFAQKLASFAEVFVNEAFGASHRRTASLWALPRLLHVRLAGRRLMAEATAYRRLAGTPRDRLLVVLGEDELGPSLDRFEALLGRAGAVACASALGRAYVASRPSATGRSGFDAQSLVRARSLLDQAARHGTKLLVPTDFVAKQPGGDPFTAPAALVPESAVVVGLGPDSLSRYANAIQAASAVLFVSRRSAVPGASASETSALLDALAESPAFTVAAGDDTRAASSAATIERIDHVSLDVDNGLRLCFGRSLPGLDALHHGESNS